jgi:uroporphyrin-III C-methyltransferase/precorrin-2 dehydrogenase/sirohydrochlorin ferrochelatase
MKYSIATLNFFARECLSAMESFVAQWVNDSDRTPQVREKVYLVGGGPGDPDLLTIKALKLLQKAEVVLYDALISPEILNLVNPSALLVSVGKRANNHSKKQHEINQLLVKYAKQKRGVVRLKGGDPFIYGRGGEELQALIAAGIDFEVVPGITAASGCASYAGIPLTHREHSQTVMFVTAQCKNSQENIDWTSIARQNQTVVVYMGLLKNDVLARQLIAYGRCPNTPVAIIENGTTSAQRVITGTLGCLTEMVEEQQVISPALMIIGEVVALAHQLDWYPNNQLIQHISKMKPVYKLREAV